MRLELSGSPPPPGAMRFKAATYDRLAGADLAPQRAAAARCGAVPAKGLLPASPRRTPTAAVADLPRAAAVDQPDRAHGDAGGRSRDARCSISTAAARSFSRGCRARSSSTGALGARGSLADPPVERARGGRPRPEGRSGARPGGGHRRRSPRSPRSGRATARRRSAPAGSRRDLLSELRYTAEFIGRGGESADRVLPRSRPGAGTASTSPRRWCCCCARRGSRRAWSPGSTAPSTLVGARLGGAAVQRPRLGRGLPPGTRLAGLRSDAARRPADRDAGESPRLGARRRGSSWSSAGTAT